MRNKRICEEALSLKGRVRITVRDAKTGEIIEEQEVKNLVVAVGKQHICNLLIGASTDSFSYCGVGSGTTQPSLNDTDLESPVGSRKQVTDRFRTGNVATFSTFFSSQDNNGSWNECGLFTHQTGGVMLCRALFTSTINKDSTKTVTVDWDIEVG